MASLLQLLGRAALAYLSYYVLSSIYVGWYSPLGRQKIPGVRRPPRARSRRSLSSPASRAAGSRRPSSALARCARTTRLPLISAGAPWPALAPLTAQIFRIEELHRKHGDVVRIGPSLVAINHVPTLLAIFNDKRYDKGEFYDVRWRILARH